MEKVTPCANVPQAVRPTIAGDTGCSYDIGQFRSMLPELEAMNIFAAAPWPSPGIGKPTAN
jgi:hypothetical protein